MAEIVYTRAESTDENATFGLLLQQFLASKGVQAVGGVILVCLLDDGFTLLQMGPRPLSERDVEDYVIWVGEQTREAQNAS